MRTFIKDTLKVYSRILPDELYIKLVFRKHMGYFPDLKNPKTFNEKLQWLKLHDRKPEYTMMVDKYEAKKYVASIIGDEYIIPTLGVWDRFEDIDFDSLPDKFVIKCTHDSAGMLIVQDKNTMNITAAKKKLNGCLKSNFYYGGREWPYKNVKPRIIAEKYIEDKNNQADLNDYKFFCFNGVVKCFKIDFDRFVNHRANYYDLEMKQLPFGEAHLAPDYNRKFDKPEHLDVMISIAEKLSDSNPFLRIDLYNVNGIIYFGETTFFPDSGWGKLTSDEWDNILGSWIELPKEK